MRRSGDKGIDVPIGFSAGGMHCGAKRKRKDLSLIFSVKGCTSAALFTRNTVKAAPLVRGMAQMKAGNRLRAVVVNSGNANCMTGERGLKDAEKMANVTAEALGVPPGEVFVSSTGIIGQYMDMGPILSGIRTLSGNISPNGFESAADGIMTTDGFRKMSSRKFRVNGREITMTGIAKGAGMIKPDMATTLVFVITDAAISRGALAKALSLSTERSFNSITVDGDMSTNDTALIMANGMACNPRISLSSGSFEKFTSELGALMLELAAMVVRDGEGAGKFIEVRVKGARKDAEAKKAAETVADSLLVKCAASGEDPNWGRIASSVGASGVRFDPGKMTIKLDGVAFFRKGKPVLRAKRLESPVFKGKDILIEVDLASGKGSSVFYSCDITTKYIDLNSFYTT